jgi:hypothetical protein
MRVHVKPPSTQKQQQKKEMNSEFIPYLIQLSTAELVFVASW